MTDQLWDVEVVPRHYGQSGERKVRLTSVAAIEYMRAAMAGPTTGSVVAYRTLHAEGEADAAVHAGGERG